MGEFMKTKKRYIYIGILFIFLITSCVNTSLITSQAATLASGQSLDGTVQWTVSADGTMTIVPTNGKEGTFTQSCKTGSGSVNACLPNGYIFSRAFTNLLPDQHTKNIGDSVKRIIANQGIIHLKDAYGLFSANGDNPSLTYADLSSFDTTQCERFDYMFYNQNKLTEIKVGSKFTGATSTDFCNMFGNCTSLKQIPWFKQFDVSNGVNFQWMFYGAGLEYLDLSNFDTSKYLKNSENRVDFSYSGASMDGFLARNDNLKKITFGQKSLGTYKPKTENPSEGYILHQYGIPFEANSLSYRHTSDNKIVNNAWTRNDKKYKDLSYNDIIEEFKINPSFLVGTWFRDDFKENGDSGNKTSFRVDFIDGYTKRRISEIAGPIGTAIEKRNIPTAPSYASDGIKFEGWFDEDNNDCSNGIQNVTRDMTVTARYRPYLVTAKFILDDGSEAHINMNTAYRTRLTLPQYTGKVPANKKFELWSVKLNEGNTKLFRADESVDVSALIKCPTDDTETITFRAVFSDLKSNTNTNNNQNTDKNDNKNTTNTVSNTNTNTIMNANENHSTAEPQAVSSPVASQQSQQQNTSDLVQTGIDMLPVVLSVLSASIVAIMAMKRMK